MCMKGWVYRNIFCCIESAVLLLNDVGIRNWDHSLWDLNWILWESCIYCSVRWATVSVLAPPTLSNFHTFPRDLGCTSRLNKQPAFLSLSSGMSTGLELQRRSSPLPRCSLQIQAHRTPHAAEKSKQAQAYGASTVCNTCRLKCQRRSLRKEVKTD